MLKNRVQQKAAELGFDLFGVAPVQSIPETTLFEKWLAKNYAGDMAYLSKNKDKRIDPELIVPNARSVMMCAMNYHTDAPLSTDSAPADSGWIARYAWGDDYHDLVKKRIKALYDFIVAETNGVAKGRYYVDTGPVLEKAWAKYAGLGWIGKNTCLINKQRGSFFFLAAIITDAELGFDQPAADHCGSCTRCIDACPTDALLAPYVLDANLCISYLTIEKRDAIPVSIRDNIGRQVFGCDICQDVCPWNSKSVPTAEKAFQPREGLVNPQLGALLEIDSQKFLETFRHSPIKRAKLRGLVRNALVAAGNSGEETLMPQLARLANSDDELLAEHAGWAISKLAKTATQRREDQR